MRVLHIIPELRAVHVERYSQWSPEDVVLYRKLKWDLDPQMIPRQAHRLSRRSLRAALQDQSIEVVELPEPLWMRVLPLTTAIAVAARLWRGQSIRLTTYCIENNDFRSLVGYAGPLSKPLTRMVIALIGKVIAPRLDRVVYGSEGSETTYGTIPQMALVLSRVVPELPDARQLIPANARGALFVGRLESRKGVIQLLEAWSKIEGQTDHHLTLVGDGPLMADVQAWVAENPNRRRAVGQLSRNDTEMNYLNHRILVAPSVREGRWREQVGLPIVEALSHGLTVVTTCETGIAGWLLRNGHTVIEQSSELADAILARLREPLEPSEVAAALPLVGGRKIADDWMRSRDGR